MKSTNDPSFLAISCSERSIKLDLVTEAERSVRPEFARKADTAPENTKPGPGISEKLRVNYATQQLIDPEFLYASKSDVGQSGPCSQPTGFDLIAQAMSDALKAMKVREHGLVNSGVSVGNLGAGLFALYGILSAIVVRGRTGRRLLGHSRSSAPSDSANRMNDSHQAYPVSDGMFLLGAANQQLSTALCKLVNRSDCSGDPRISDNKVPLVTANGTSRVKRMLSGFINSEKARKYAFLFESRTRKAFNDNRTLQVAL